MITRNLQPNRPNYFKHPKIIPKINCRGTKIKLYDLPYLDWNDSQLVYHTLARMNDECLILTGTKQPYTCIGFAQDLKKELDLNYCDRHNIPYFRRETGGGTVYLDENQLFYQVIVRRDNPITPRLTEAFFRRFLNPVVKVLGDLGISGKFVPVNDLIVDNKKISGNGGGEIGACKVVIGNLLLDFDFDIMARILNVPNEDFRARVLRSMKENLTTLKDQLGTLPDMTDLRKMLISEYGELMGPLEPAQLSEDTLSLMKELDDKFSQEKWLFQRVPKTHGRSVKIREGVMLYHKIFSRDDWKVEANLEVSEDRIIEFEVLNRTNFSASGQEIKMAIVGKLFAEKEVLNTLNELHTSLKK